jgi:hypothetical protein
LSLRMVDDVDVTEMSSEDVKSALKRYDSRTEIEIL